MSTKKDKFSSKDKNYMRLAIDLARARKGLTGENPSVGCVIVKNDEIISIGQTGYNGRPHAESNAISNSLQNLAGSKMYVTLEPCHMCAKAIVDARICSVIFGCPEPKTGSIISIDNFFDKKELNHNPQYQNGLFSEESSKLLKDFFSLRR